MPKQEQLELRRAYSRGYSAAVHGRWPDHRPIKPPDEITAALVTAAQNLRDAVDNQLALFDPDDELQKTLGEPMDEVTAALIRLSGWIKTGHDIPEGTGR